MTVRKKSAKKRRTRRTVTYERTVYEVVCDECGKPFDAVDKRAQYCGPTCRQRAHRRGRQKGNR